MQVKTSKDRSEKQDVFGVLWNLAKRHVPLQALQEKLEAFVEDGAITKDEAEEIEPVLEQMHAVHREATRRARLGRDSTRRRRRKGPP